MGAACGSSGLETGKQSAGSAGGVTFELLRCIVTRLVSSFCVYVLMLTSQPRHRSPF